MAFAGSTCARAGADPVLCGWGRSMAVATDVWPFLAGVGPAAGVVAE